MARSERPTILIQADGHTLATAELHPTGTAGVVHSDTVSYTHLTLPTNSRV